MQSLTVKDFSGGYTENFIGADKKYASRIFNLVIDNDTKFLRLRPGSRKLIDFTQNQNDLSQVIDGLISYSNDFKLLILRDGKVFNKSESNLDYENIQIPIEDIKGNTDGRLYDHNVSVNYDQWSGNVLITDGVNPVRKLYYNTKNDVNKFVWRDAGLPSVFSGDQVQAGNIINPATVDLEILSNLGTCGQNTTSYIYYFVYYIQYQANGKIFEDYGPVSFYRKANACNNLGSEIGTDANPGEDSFMTIRNIPKLAETSLFNGSELKLRIYRSVAGGTAPYFLTEFNAEFGSGNFISYNDTKSDLSLLKTTEPVLYIGNNAFQNSIPPKAKYVHITRNTAFYAGILNDDATYDYNIIYQSKVGRPDSVPRELFERFDDHIVGLSSTLDALIVFGKKKIYRVTGLLNDFASNSYNVTVLSENAGCVSHKSIVKVFRHIYWLARDGIYVTDGNSVQRMSISNHISRKLVSWIDNFGQNIETLQGVYDDVEQRLYWSIAPVADQFFRNSNITLSRVRNLLCLQLGLSDQGVFPLSIWGSSPDLTIEQNFEEDRFDMNVGLFFKGSFIRGSSIGSLFVHNDKYTYDSYSKQAQDRPLDRRFIDWLFRSVALDFDHFALLKWCSSITFGLNSAYGTSGDLLDYAVVCNIFPDLKVEPRLVGELKTSQKVTNPIYKSFTNFDSILDSRPDLDFDDPDIDWWFEGGDFESHVAGETYRRMRLPSGHLRVKHLQVEFRASNYKILSVPNHSIVVSSLDGSSTITNLGNRLLNVNMVLSLSVLHDVPIERRITPNDVINKDMVLNGKFFRITGLSAVRGTQDVFTFRSVVNLNVDGDIFGWTANSYSASAVFDDWSIRGFLLINEPFHILDYTLFYRIISPYAIPGIGA